MENVKKSLLDILNTVLENRGKEKLISIEMDTDLRNDLGFESLDFAELTVRVEAEYNVDIFEDGIIVKFSDIFNKIANL
jgi:acyl carrier protein